MPRKRKNKPLPKHLEPIPEGPTSWKEGQSLDIFKAAFARIGKQAERREAWLEVYEKDWDETRNPLCVLDAFLFARGSWGRPVPEWILKALEGIAWDALNPSPQKRGPSKWTQYFDRHIRQTAVNLILLDLNQDPSLTVLEACKLAAEYIRERWGRHYDLNTIRKWYNARA